LGAPSSFIIRKSAIEVLKSTSPPMGVLDKINPTTARYQLYDGDMMVLASDGVVDALGENGVIDVVNSADTFNPQTLAEKLLDSALDGGAEDDCTVLVLRLVAV
jgi:stage II sporulation protein E